jgi:SAM-dependent methyltransferase
MNQKDITPFLYALYDDVSPMSISISCRKKLGIYEDRSFVYGESHLPSLYEIFNEIKPQPGEIFYDLGSGSGRLVLYAALSFPFAKSIGIELLDGLVNVAQTKLVLGKKRLFDLPNFDPNKLGEIEFILADFTKADLKGANVVYIASTCFEDEFMLNLTLHLEKQLAVGTRVITFARPLPSQQFKIIKHQFYPMEWGQATIFFHEKTYAG